MLALGRLAIIQEAIKVDADRLEDLLDERFGRLPVYAFLMAFHLDLGSLGTCLDVRILIIDENASDNGPSQKLEDLIKPGT